MESMTTKIATEESVRQYLELEDGRDELVYLPVGLKHEGRIIRLVTLKEPDGYTESLQTDQSNRKAFTSIINATLADCIVRIEGVDIPNKRDDGIEFKMEIVKQLSEADRQYLLLRLYRLQHGEIFKTKVTCTHCQESQQIERNLRTDLTLHYVDDNLVDSRNDDRMIVKSIRPKYPLMIGGELREEVDVKIPDGATTMSIERLNTNIGDAKTKMIQMMLAVNHFTRGFSPSESEIRGWSTKVRNSLIEAVADARIGFVNEITEKCTNCSETFNTVYPIGELLGK